MNQSLLRRIRRHIVGQRLWEPKTRVVAALSGGSDSVAQLFVLHALAADGAVTLVGAAHLDHGLRSEAADDAAFCRALCARLGVPLVVESAAVAALASAWHLSVEAAARRARYAFLERARVELAADLVAVAHTADDQAETVLLRLLRGAGTRGLRGILPRRGTVVRPVLDVTRDDLRGYLKTLGEGWVEDRTNTDVAFARNRVRHELMPLLAARFQPAVVRVLARTAAVAVEEDALLERAAATAAATLVRAEARGLRLASAGLAALPRAVARRVARRAIEALAPPHAPDLADVEALLAVCTPRGPRAAEPAGLRAERFSTDAVLLSRDARETTTLPARTLAVPGRVTLPELGAGCQIVAGLRTSAGTFPGCHVRLGTHVGTQLVVRSRRPGDRMHPMGVGGSKKLQDVLVDRKVPRHERDRVPVVTDASGRIVWVVGQAVDARAVAPDGADDVIVLTFDQPGDPGSEGS